MSRQTLIAAGRCAAGHEIIGEASIIRDSNGFARCRECARLWDIRRRANLPSLRRPQIEVGRCAKAGHELIEGSYRVYSYQRPHGIQTVIVCLECKRIARQKSGHESSD